MKYVVDKKRRTETYKVGDEVVLSIAEFEDILSPYSAEN